MLYLIYMIVSYRNANRAAVAACTDAANDTDYKLAA